MIFLRSVYVAALLYAAVRILEGLIIIALQVRRLARCGSLVCIARCFNGAHAAPRVFGCFALVESDAELFWFADSVDGENQAALNASIAIGSLKHLSGSHPGVPDRDLGIFSSLEILRFLLEEDVYRISCLPSGIPYAISTVLHYLILLMGFFIALGALGIDLTKITILAGAFSVGVGFGLQNVINNFVLV